MVLGMLFEMIIHQPIDDVTFVPECIFFDDYYSVDCLLKKRKVCFDFVCHILTITYFIFDTVVIL